jgi:fluoride exporter
VKLAAGGSLILQKYFFIMLGGALGSAARYWVGTTVGGRMGNRFPFGTLVVNITACFILGLSLEYLNRHTDFSPSLRYLIPIGFIGAYSTFSTFEWETFSNLNQGAFWIAIIYVGVSLVAGLIAVALGVTLVKSLA